MAEVSQVMNDSNVRRLILIGFISLFSMAGGCGGQQGESGVSPYYQLPVIPIKVSYDVLSRKLQVSVSGSIQTPVGTFGATASAGPSPKQFSGVRTLTIESGTGKYVYQLERGKRYSISLPSDENGEAKVVYSGTDDNLSIVIPNPTGDTVGELRRRLKEEQGARGRADAGKQFENRGTTEKGKWVVILSGNVVLANAKDLVQKLEAYHPTIYFRQGLYRTTVGPYITRDVAISARDYFRSEIASDAYIENMGTWCSSPQPSAGMYVCE